MFPCLGPQATTVILMQYKLRMYNCIRHYANIKIIM